MTWLKALASLFWREGYRLYAVGGYVRNLLMGLPASDIDVASACPIETLEKMARETENLRVTVVNRRLGTCQIQFGDLAVEHTCFRKESYGQGHQPLSAQAGVPLIEDAFRRDFTVNALYRDLLTGEILDPTGRGLADVKARRLRTTTRQPEKILADDGLRLMRMVRFACQLGFHIDKELFLCARAHAGKLEEISVERVREELNQILLSDVKYNVDEQAHKRGLLFLKAAGLLEKIFPDLKAGRGLVQGPYHKYRVEYHGIMTCCQTPPILELRLAGLLHDVGKPFVFQETGRFYGHDKRGADLSESMLRRLKYPNALIKTVTSLIAMHMYDLNGKAREKKVRQFAQKWGRAYFQMLPFLREADFVGSGYEKKPIATAEKFRRVYEEMEARNVPFTVKDLDIGGEDLAAMGYKGREIGEALAYLLKHCAAKPGENRRVRLKQLAGQKKFTN